MFNTILIFIMVAILIVILYKVNKNIEKLINCVKQNISEKQKDEDEYEYEENIENIKNIENFKSKSTCCGCRFLERHDKSNVWGEVEHHWYCTEYKKYIVKGHGSLASSVKPICRNNKELKKEYKELVDIFDKLYN